MAKYPKFLMEHFQNPRNVGEMSNPDGVGTVGNASCGDIMQIFIKVNGDKIVEAKFKTFGCGAAIATSSILTERIKGATLDEATKISEETSREVLSQLPKEKVPCFTLATDALKLAIEEYRCKQAGVHERGGFDTKEMGKE
ncbi:MAG TPA: iron-sulfur cluster assembly scaffold protein [Thermodesulfobacteriota bacterium]|jgi:nitrogen fixation NifU-like protein|nr:iron-sulfur cluster assembly scaffold protein [Thermodesulfobacteriota bacterium]